LSSFAAKLGRLLLVAALLVAQHSALAHGVWHLAGAPAAYGAASAAGGPQDSSGSALCKQHEALGSVLGALGSADACQLLAPQQANAISGAVQSTAHLAPLPPSSRDPPSLR
jgi:hypothetical protein